MYPETDPSLDRRRRGARRSSGATFEKRSPIDDRVVAAVTRGRPPMCRAPSTSRPRAADAWARTPAPQRGEILGRAARAAARERARARRDRPDRNRQAVEERGRRSRLVRRSRHLHGRRGQPLLRQDDDESDSESHGADRARADRHLRGDHAVQQPAGRRRLEGVPGAAVRQRRRREVARADAVHRGRVRQAAAGCRPAARRVFASCRASVPKSARRSSQDDRVGVVSFTGSVADRQADSEDGQRARGAREGLPRARRQESARRLRRCRSDAGGGARGGVGVHRRRAALRVGQPHHRVRSRLRRVPRRVARARRRR